MGFLGAHLENGRDESLVFLETAAPLRNSRMSCGHACSSHREARRGELGARSDPPSPSLRTGFLLQMTRVRVSTMEKRCSCRLVGGSITLCEPAWILVGDKEEGDCCPERRSGVCSLAAIQLLRAEKPASGSLNAATGSS